MSPKTNKKPGKPFGASDVIYMGPTVGAAPDAAAEEAPASAIKVASSARKDFSRVFTEGISVEGINLDHLDVGGLIGCGTKSGSVYVFQIKKRSEAGIIIECVQVVKGEDNMLSKRGQITNLKREPIEPIIRKDRPLCFNDFNIEDETGFGSISTIERISIYNILGHEDDEDETNHFPNNGETDELIDDDYEGEE